MYIVIQNDDNNDDIYRSLKYGFQNFKSSLRNMRILNQYIVYLEENKSNSRKKGPQLSLIAFYSKDIRTFNKFEIKNTPVIK